MLIAANLRAGITAVGPVLGDIRASTGMSAAAAGLLTSLPLIMFSAMAQPAVLLGRRFRVERVLPWAMVAIAGGCVLRSAGPAAAVLAGTTAIGAAMAVGNILLPTYLKQRGRTGPIMALYATTLQASAGIAAAVSVPLAEASGLAWRGALGVWAILAVVAALVWRATAMRAAPDAVPTEPGPRAVPRIRRSALAWWVTAYFGFQSMIFYGLVTWLPTLLEDGGTSKAGAGVLLAVMQFAGLPAALAMPVLAARRADQRGLVLIGGAICMLGVGGLLLGSTGLQLASVVLIGFGNSTLFSLGLTFLVLRAADAPHVAALGGMAQSLGYLMAAASPVTLGWLHDVTGAWTVPVVAVELAVAGALVAGWSAGRGQIGPPGTPAA
jgi:CP family cyanate transporter-like MFS transporter